MGVRLKVRAACAQQSSAFCCAAEGLQTNTVGGPALRKLPGWDLEWRMVERISCVPEDGFGLREILFHNKRLPEPYFSRGDVGVPRVQALAAYCERSAQQQLS